jgi:YidC/Oxa1 family membrane protein insertase
MTMDLKRVLLYFALFMVSMSLWQHWLADTRKPSAKVAIKTAHSATPQLTSSQSEQQVSSSARSELGRDARNFSATSVLRSNTLQIKVALEGGTIIETKLLQYLKALDSDEPFVLLSEAANKRYLAESDVSGFGLSKALRYHLVSNSTQTHQSTTSQKLVLEAGTKHGLNVLKTISIDNSYLIEVSHRLSNDSQVALKGYLYTQLLRQPPATKSSFFGVSSYTGAAISMPPKTLYKKVSFSTMKDKRLYEPVKSGWVAMQQPYFISAWVPEKSTHAVLYSHYAENEEHPHYTIGSKTTELTLKPGETLTLHSKLYTGPVITETLKTIAPGLDLSIDYGIFWWFSTPIFYVLKTIHDVLGNWGWAIVVVTLLIKLLFFHLSAKSYHSMARLRQLQPKVEALRERYKDQKEKMTKAMMELYAKEKVSPFGGCLPILIQIPVFISLYWVLIESVELRQAPWVLWIHDLSARDPYFILPVIMGATMLIQQMLSPPPADPTQKQLMMLMPVGFTFLFATFPAGLVLYWTVNNAVSILQQWIITKRVEQAS